MERKFTYSFVIPHHNTPDLLKRLLYSIPQREDIEIIVVDDNSDADKKARVERDDVKVVYIDSEHTGGAGRARNVGLDIVSGKWLLFADADDIYKPGFIDILDEYKDDDIDMLYYNVDSVDSDTLLPGKHQRGILQNKLISTYDGSEQSKNNLMFFGYAPWRRMLNTDYVISNGFRFEEVAKSNDNFFSLQVGYFAGKFKVDSRTVYTVTYFKDGITYGKMTREKIQSIFLVARRKAVLFEYMGHPEWNKCSIRGTYSQSCIKYIIVMFRKNLYLGLSALWFYITNYFDIERKSNYYVDVIKDIEKRRICKYILSKA